MRLTSPSGRPYYLGMRHVAALIACLAVTGCAGQRGEHYTVAIDPAMAEETPVILAALDDWRGHVGVTFTTVISGCPGLKDGLICIGRDDVGVQASCSLNVDEDVIPIEFELLAQVATPDVFVTRQYSVPPCCKIRPAGAPVLTGVAVLTTRLPGVPVAVVAAPAPGACGERVRLAGFDPLAC